MQTSQSFNIHFTTRPDKVRDGKEPIYACLTVNKQSAYIALKHNADPKNWDSGKETAKGEVMISAVFPTINLSHQTEFSRYRKAKPGKKTLPLNPLVIPGKPPLQIG